MISWAFHEGCVKPMLFIFKTPWTHNTMFKKTSKIFEKWNMTYCNILIYCLLSSFLHAFWTFQFVQLSFDLGDIIFWMMRENEKKDESKKFLLQEKSSLSSPLPPICLPPRSYTSSPESPTPWWNRRVKHEKRYTMKCTFLCLHGYAWIEYIWYNMSKYLPRSRAPSSGRNGPSLHPRNPQAGSAAAKNWQNVKLVRNSNPKFLEHACLSTHLIKALFPLKPLTWPKMAKLRESLKTFSLYFFDFAAPEQKQNVFSSYDANLSALDNSIKLSFFTRIKLEKLYSPKTRKLQQS